MRGWAYPGSHLCGCRRPASRHTVRGVSERGLDPEFGEYKVWDCRCSFSGSSRFFQPFNAHIKTTEQRTGILRYSDWYTGR